MRSIVEQRVQQLTAHEEGMQNISTQFNEALTLYRKSVLLLHAHTMYVYIYYMYILHVCMVIYNVHVHVHINRRTMYMCVW